MKALLNTSRNTDLCEDCITTREVCEALTEKSLIRTPEGEYYVIQISFGYIVCESVKNGKLKFFRYEELTF